MKTKHVGFTRLFLTFLFAACPLSPLAAQTTSTDVDFAAKYQKTANDIIAFGRSKSTAYMKLQELCDDIGNRLSGSPALDQAIAWAQESMKKDGQENVRAEKVMVRKWVRGNESCQLISPRLVDINMLGLGGSVGTPAEGITADVIVVRDEAELKALPDEKVKGKIIVFNFPMQQYSETTGSGYGDAVQYRSNGATWAAEKGGVAALVRSVTAYSLDSPHTGAMRYTNSEVPKVPTAAITIEGATMMARLQARGITPRVTLKMQAADQGMVPSANVIAEIVGSEKPDEIVLIGGHIDSWDVGQGAQDDGAGCVAAMEALRILRKLNLKPRRTIRVVLWTNEENGLAGAREYAARHKDEIHVAGIESDSGGFKPKGLSLDLQDDGLEEDSVPRLSKMLQLLAPIGATRATNGYSGADVGQLKQFGCACMGLNVDGRLYFNTHHTHADTVDKVNAAELNDCAITLAVTSFVLADMEGRIDQPSK